MSRFLIAGLVAVCLVAPGCGKSDDNPPGYGKENFQKSEPPPEWRGPGQPGGPPAGAMTGPGGAAQPPPDITGGQ
ncbi:MAG TPA: hypothetical protein VGE01_02960 [Fimbriimonas sp.]